MRVSWRSHSPEVEAQAADAVGFPKLNASL
jgi:hypothetical protein